MLFRSNNPMPFLVYKRAIDVDNDHPEKTIEGLFGANGWGAMWRNGVYDYLHYHATVHEVLGIARGNAIVRFGGDSGTEIAVAAGDVAILPAGTGHQCLSASPDFSVVGAYPPGARMQITQPTSENYAKALETIPKVKLPTADPVTGADGPLVRLWRRQGGQSASVPTIFCVTTCAVGTARDTPLPTLRKPCRHCSSP